jgi:tetraacyldisaccharide 4'-kinase
MASKGSQTPSYWYDGSAVPFAARLLAPLYAGVVAVRRALYRRRWLKRHALPVPVIVVGNVTAGGTGKTPLTIALVQRLREAGWKPGVASRGYGREQANMPRWVEATGVPVRVDADRVAAGRALVEAGCDIIVCDDGLQHYRLARDIEIEVVDAQRRYGNGRLIPAGPLREPASRAQECDFRVVNLGQASAEPSALAACGFGEWPMQLHIDTAQPLSGGRARALAHFRGQRVHAVAGIAHPQRFFDMLRAHGIGVVPHAFADHHAYQASDLRFGSELPVLMTEKDAVKCKVFANEWHFAVPLAADLPAAFWVNLLDRVNKLGKR